MFFKRKEKKNETVTPQIEITTPEGEYIKVVFGETKVKDIIDYMDPFSIDDFRQFVKDTSMKEGDLMEGEKPTPFEEEYIEVFREIKESDDDMIVLCFGINKTVKQYLKDTSFEPIENELITSVSLYVEGEALRERFSEYKFTTNMGFSSESTVEDIQCVEEADGLFKSVNPLSTKEPEEDFYGYLLDLEYKYETPGFEHPTCKSINVSLTLQDGMITYCGLF